MADSKLISELGGLLSQTGIGTAHEPLITGLADALGKSSSNVCCMSVSLRDACSNLFRGVVFSWVGARGCRKQAGEENVELDHLDCGWGDTARYAETGLVVCLCVSQSLVMLSRWAAHAQRPRGHLSSKTHYPFRLRTSHSLSLYDP